MADQSYVSSISSGNSDVLQRGQLHLEPIPAASFTFSIIFAILTSAQMLKAIKNIQKRLTRKPPSIILQEYSLGCVFPWLLLLTTVLLTISYVLHGVWVTFRSNGTPDEVQSPSGDHISPYACAMHLMTTLADISLVTALLALLSHRARLILTSSKINLPKSLALSTASSAITSRNQKRLTCINLKMVFDSLLIMSMVGLSFAGSILDGRDLHVGEDLGVVQNGKHLLVYDILFLIAVFNIGMSAFLLHTETKRHFMHTMDDSRISKYTGYIISPCFISYALIPIIYSTTTTTSTNANIIAQWSVAYLIIGCIIKCAIITICLGFGIPSENNDISGVNEPRRAEPAKTTLQLRKPTSTLTSPSPCLNPSSTRSPRSASEIRRNRPISFVPATPVAASASQSSLDVGASTWGNVMRMNGQFLANWVI